MIRSLIWLILQIVSKLKVLHITPWYPSPSMPGNGIFIQRQIAGMAAHMDQFVLHIDLSFDGPVNESESGQHFKRISRKLNLKLWRWYELRFYRMLRDALIKMDASNEYTHVVFHIAYPALIFLEKLRPHLPEKILISEHWSAYGLHFSSKKRLNRIKEMFKKDIPLVVVSKALGESICDFSQQRIPYSVIPNVVDSDFSFNANAVPGNYFFSAAFWKEPKKPLELLQAIYALKSRDVHIQLRIAGYGPLVETMKRVTAKLGIEDCVFFEGRLGPKDLAKMMNEAIAFVMPTEYETFSVICAEALACGCPVIASQVGAIPELINETNGILVGDQKGWTDAFIDFQTRSFERKLIATNSASMFSVDKIANQFTELIQKL